MLFTRWLPVMAAVLPLLTGPSVAVFMPVFTTRSVNGSDVPAPLSADEIKTKVLATLPADRILTSSELHQYFATHGQDLLKLPESNRTVYLTDTGDWVILSTANTTVEGNLPLASRQYDCDCFGYTSYSVLFTHAYWSPWEHLTSCQFSNAGEGGQISYTTEQSISVSYGGGVTAVDPFFGVLQAAFSFSITYEHSIATGYSCNFGANDAAQIWGRHLMAWAAVQSAPCFSCDVCGSYCDGATGGWIDSPASSDDTTSQQYGCSTTNAGSYLRCS